jgi:ankyrin repeat protein
MPRPKRKGLESEVDAKKALLAEWQKSLAKATLTGDEIETRKIIQEKPDDPEACNDGLRRLLQKVAGQGQDRMVRILHEGGAQLQAEGNEVSALFRAVEWAHLGVVRALLELGANPNERDRFQRTPLFLAAAKGYTEVLETLLNSGADVNVTGSDGRTVMIHLAAEKVSSDERVLDLLLKKRADLEVKDEHERTALLWAAATGKTTMVKVLLESQGQKADIKARNHRNKTAVHLAADNNHVETLKLLLEKGADPSAKSHGDWTPLHNAAYGGYEEIVDVLTSTNADINARTNRGKTPLHWAAEKGYIKVVKLLLKRRDIQWNSKDNSEQTPLLRAAKHQHAGIVQLLSALSDGRELSETALRVCKEYHATVVDFLGRKPKGSRAALISKHTVFDVLYGIDPKSEKSLVTTLTQNIFTKPAFRWIHLPANNVSSFPSSFNAFRLTCL